MFFCPSCCGTVHAHPLQCGCFPATPVKALDLRLNNTGESPVWFDEHALLHMVHLQNKSLETADEAVVDAMNRMCAKVSARALTPPQGRFWTEQHTPMLPVKTITYAPLHRAVSAGMYFNTVTAFCLPARTAHRRARASALTRWSA
jgi:hypothetical protein